MTKLSIITFIANLLVTSSEFFTSALADGLSLKVKWQQVSLSLQDSSQYSWPISVLQ